MKILLDTNILIWSLYMPEKLSEEALQYLKNTNNRFLYSVISLWETEIKHIKFPEQMPVSAKSLNELCKSCNMELIHLKPEHIFNLSELKRADDAPVHKDPFDKILLCQAVFENCVFLTHDSKLPHYDLPFIKFV